MNRLRGVGLLLPVLAGCSGVEPPMTAFAPKSDFAKWTHTLYLQVIGWDSLILMVVAVAGMFASQTVGKSARQQSIKRLGQPPFKNHLRKQLTLRCLVGERRYVTYAKQDADKRDDVAGKGNGFVNVFDTDGHFIRRIASRGKLNSPWGLAFAPADFGRFSNDLLVGNFGNGRINAFDLEHRPPRFRGQLRDSKGKPITIDSLWALTFGNGQTAGPTNVLFFTAGIDEEQHGLFGSLKACRRNQCEEAQ